MDRPSVGILIECLLRICGIEPCTNAVITLVSPYLCFILLCTYLIVLQLQFHQVMASLQANIFASESSLDGFSTSSFQPHESMHTNPLSPPKLPILNLVWLFPSSQGAVILSVLRSLIVWWSELGVNWDQVDSPHRQHLGTSHCSRLLSRLGYPTSLLLPSNLPPKIPIGSGRWLAICALALRVCQTRLRDFEGFMPRPQAEYGHRWPWSLTLTYSISMFIIAYSPVLNLTTDIPNL